MTMIQCPECGHKLSGAAVKCMSCGRPMYLRNAKVILVGFVLVGLLYLVVFAILKGCAGF